jgi:hypothetical protein
MSRTGVYRSILIAEALQRQSNELCLAWWLTCCNGAEYKDQGAMFLQQENITKNS